MIDGDFELDGYLLGKTQPVFVQEWSTSGSESRHQDSLNPFGDNRHFGRDYLTPPGLEFKLGVNTSDASAALAALGDIHRMWANASRRRVPGAESVLRYRVAGRDRRVYGRPRRFIPEPEQFISQGHVAASAGFDLTDSLHYSDALQTRRVTPLPGVSGSVPLPAQLPMVFSGGAVRSGLIDDVGGDAPAPVEIVIQGPVTGTWSVTIGGVKVEATHSLAYDRWLTIDTRRMTVLGDDGANLSGKLSRYTFLPDARLPPGPAEIVFERNDTTGTSYADVSWRSTWYGF